jgi:hypothetical protein
MKETSKKLYLNAMYKPYKKFKFLVIYTNGKGEIDIDAYKTFKAYKQAIYTYKTFAKAIEVIDLTSR